MVCWVDKISATEMVHLFLNVQESHKRAFVSPLLSPPLHLQLLFGFPKICLLKQEVLDSPEPERWRFPQETWCISSRGTLDRQTHVKHTHISQQEVAHTQPVTQK